MNPQTLIEKLQLQARAYDPQPPAGLERKISEALVTARRESPTRWSIPRFAWGALATAAAVALAIFLTRPHEQTPAPKPEQLVKMPSPNMPNPITLAHQLVDSPMETELRALMQDLSRTTDTVTRVLPAPKPAKTNDKPLQGAAEVRSSHV